MSVQDNATKFDEMNEGAVKAVLIGIIPIFGTVITIGWGNIFAALPIFDGHLSIIAYCFGLFLAFIGIKLTKAIAAELVRLMPSLAEHKPPSVLVKLQTTWPYLLPLIIISALGTVNTVFIYSARADVLTEGFKENQNALTALRAKVEEVLKTPEYDSAKKKLEMTRKEIQALAREVAAEAEKGRDRRLQSVQASRENIELLWSNVVSEAKHPARPGIGQESINKYKLIQDEFKGLATITWEPMVPIPCPCPKLDDFLAGFETLVTRQKDRVFNIANATCEIDEKSLQLSARISEKLAGVRPLTATTLRCDKVSEEIKKFTMLVLEELEGVQASMSENEKNSIKKKNELLAEIDKAVTTTRENLEEVHAKDQKELIKAYEKSANAYEVSLGSLKSYIGTDIADLQPKVLRSEIVNLGKITNVIQLLISQWRSATTWVVIFAALLVDLVFIQIYVRWIFFIKQKDAPIRRPRGRNTTGTAPGL